MGLNLIRQQPVARSLQEVADARRCSQEVFEVGGSVGREVGIVVDREVQVGEANLERHLDK